MTLEEVDEAIVLENAAGRRKSILTALGRRSRVLARTTHEAKLKEKI
jgi:hypothetical protein